MRGNEILSTAVQKRHAATGHPIPTSLWESGRVLGRIRKRNWPFTRRVKCCEQKDKQRNRFEVSATLFRVVEAESCSK
jgi:hypothetical protein